MRNQLDVDWSKLPAPIDDGATAHLTGMRVPSIALSATDGSTVDLSKIAGVTVVYIYPRTGRPDQPLAEGWSEFPGARGCTPQSCAFRDGYAELRAAGAARLFGSLNAVDRIPAGGGSTSASPLSAAFGRQFALEQGTESADLFISRRTLPTQGDTGRRRLEGREGVLSRISAAS